VLVVRLSDLPASAGLLRHLLFSLGKLVISVAEEDQPENRDRILRRLQLGVGSQFVGGVPQTLGVVVRIEHDAERGLRRRCFRSCVNHLISNRWIF
jgi:hypothetical protein